MSPIPPRGSIPGRKPSKGLGDVLEGTGNLLGGLLKGLGKTIESVQNLNLEDLEKLVEAQGNEEAKEKLKTLKEAMGKEGIDLSKLVKIQSGVRGRILGRPFGGGLPLERRGGPQETKFDRAKKAEVQEPQIEVYPEEKQIKVIGEMPGVEEKDITCQLNTEGTVLNISTTRYTKDVKLPSPVTKKVSWIYKNGVLVVTLIKKQG